MHISASEFILFCGDPAENVRKLNAIVPEVELMIDGDAWDLDANGTWDKQIASLKNLGVPYTVHPPAWDVNAAAPISTIREVATILNRKSVELAAQLGATQVVFHPGYYDGTAFFSKTRAKDFCYQQLESIVAAAKPHGITVAFENIAGPAMTLFTQEEFIHALDGIDPCVKFLLDVGHANMNSWDIPKVIETIGHRMGGMHLHDNNGKGDAHVPMLQGTIDWERSFAAMKASLPEDCVLVMEYNSGTPLSTLEEGKNLLLEKLG